MHVLARFWYDARVRAGLAQLLLLALFLGLIAWFVANAQANLDRLGMGIDFSMFGLAARFPISEHLIPYSPADPFIRAFFVGLLNTLMVSAVVICLSTMLGFCLALLRRSANPLLSGIAALYIEIMRNTPLIVHLLFWYVLVITSLPNVRQAFQPLPNLYLSQRGVLMPSVGISGGNGWLIWLALALAVAGLGTAILLRLRRATASAILLPAAIVGSIASLGFVWVLQGLVLETEIPELRGLNFRGGLQLTPEFTSLVVALVTYKVAFIAEIFRGGIDAVGKGQWEAGRSLGLSDGQTLRLIAFPQALRIIVPPMASQYLTAVKNTTIALAIGYPDLSAVMSTVINQSGRAIEGFSVMIAVYLVISLSVASFMNWYNHRVLLGDAR